MNAFTFTILRPNDKLHKPFESTWINGENVEEAKETLSHTYSSKRGFVLEPKRDLHAHHLSRELQKNIDKSFNSAML